jgi:hypothetical protein
MDDPEHTAMVLVLAMAWTSMFLLHEIERACCAIWEVMPLMGGTVLNGGAVARPKLEPMRLRRPEASTSSFGRLHFAHLTLCIGVISFLGFSKGTTVEEKRGSEVDWKNHNIANLQVRGGRTYCPSQSKCGLNVE